MSGELTQKLTEGVTPYVNAEMAQKLVRAIIDQHGEWAFEADDHGIENFVTEAIVPTDGTSACYVLTKPYDEADSTMHPNSQLSRVSPIHGRQSLHKLMGHVDDLESLGRDLRDAYNQYQAGMTRVLIDGKPEEGVSVVKGTAQADIAVGFESVLAKYGAVEKLDNMG